MRTEQQYSRVIRVSSRVIRVSSRVKLPCLSYEILNGLVGVPLAAGHQVEDELKDKKKSSDRHVAAAVLGLKWQCHEICWLFFLHESNPPGPLINRLTWFFWKICFRRDIQIFWQGGLDSCRKKSRKISWRCHFNSVSDCRNSSVAWCAQLCVTYTHSWSSESIQSCPPPMRDTGMITAWRPKSFKGTVTSQSNVCTSERITPTISDFLHEVKQNLIWSPCSLLFTVAAKNIIYNCRF